MNIDFCWLGTAALKNTSSIAFLQESGVSAIIV
jgi:hypothetical protein